MYQRSGSVGGYTSHDGGRRALAEIQEHRWRQALEPLARGVRPAHARPRMRGACAAARGAGRPHGKLVRRRVAHLADRPRPRRRHRHRQERPRRPEDGGDVCLDRTSGLLRAPDRSLARRPRHDHARRRAAGAVLVGRDGRAETADHLFAALQCSPRRHHLARRVRARPAGRHRAGAAAHQGGVPARAGSDDLHRHAAGAGRLPRHRAARGREASPRTSSRHSTRAARSAPTSST